MFKKFRKVATRVAVMAVALMLTATVAFAGDTVTTTQGTAGSATIADLSGVYGADGTISFSNPGIFASYSVRNATSMTGEANNAAVFLYGNTAATGGVVVDYTIAAGAAVGDSCTVSFTFNKADANGDMTSGGTESAVIIVGAAQQGGTTTPTTPTTPDSGSTGVTAPSAPVQTAKADLTELERLIAIANKLTKSEYTAESWSALIAALNNGKAMTVNHSQAKVDAAAAALQAAIDGLVKIDYTELNAAMDAANDLLKNSEFAALWNELMSAMDNANANLEGTSQAEVDAAAAALKEIVAKLNEYLEGLKAPVAAEPVEGECGVALHNVLVMLLVVSGGLNLLLGFLLANNSKKKKAKMKDTTPMVNLD